MRSRWISLAAIALGASCASRPPPAPTDLDDLPAPHPLAGHEAHYALTWRGERIGDATETLRPRPGALGELRMVRRERLTLRRQDTTVALETAITIDTDDRLRARAVHVLRQTGADGLRGAARREPDGRWRLSWGDEPPRHAAAEAVPIELVPLLVAAAPERRFDGTVLLSGYGFAVANLWLEPDGPDRVRAALETTAGVARSVAWLDERGTVRRVDADTGVGAARVAPAALGEPFAPPEMVSAAALAVAGAPADPPVLSVTPAPAAPPALPGQRAEHDGDVLQLRLLPGDGPAVPAVVDAKEPSAAARRLAPLAAELVRGAADRRAEVVALARATATLIDDDLGAPGTSAGAALAMGRGDCTAHALLFATLAEARGIATRLVTGYRLEGRTLVRHRWAVAKVDGVWMAVDPTWGEAPASPRLIGLAMHGSAAAEIAVADDLAFAGWAGVRVVFRTAGR
jgi:hypothetical protein